MSATSVCVDLRIIMNPNTAAPPRAVAFGRADDDW
jgi:hypothetical protein